MYDGTPLPPGDPVPAEFHDAKAGEPLFQTAARCGARERK